uniref:Uncharacterized protein n=1 Tax=Pristionchus pacificus TaxID=54126 RepID=A0A2A6C6U6_PRIPA|eukprot:PDM73905.1 hypothetical protein PRIPAC_41261 [Pristionchus pacificus]
MPRLLGKDLGHSNLLAELRAKKIPTTLGAAMADRGATDVARAACSCCSRLRSTTSAASTMSLSSSASSAAASESVCTEYGILASSLIDPFPSFADISQTSPHSPAGRRTTVLWAVNECCICAFFVSNNCPHLKQPKKKLNSNLNSSAASRAAEQLRLTVPRRRGLFFIHPRSLGKHDGRSAASASSNRGELAESLEESCSDCWRGSTTGSRARGILGVCTHLNSPLIGLVLGVLSLILETVQPPCVFFLNVNDYHEPPQQKLLYLRVFRCLEDDLREQIIGHVEDVSLISSQGEIEKWPNYYERDDCMRGKRERIQEKKD